MCHNFNRVACKMTLAEYKKILDTTVTADARTISAINFAQRAVEKQQISTLVGYGKKAHIYGPFD